MSTIYVTTMPICSYEEFIDTPDIGDKIQSIFIHDYQETKLELTVKNILQQKDDLKYVLTHSFETDNKFFEYYDNITNHPYETAKKKSKFIKYTEPTLAWYMLTCQLHQKEKFQTYWHNVPEIGQELYSKHLWPSRHRVKLKIRKIEERGNQLKILLGYDDSEYDSKEDFKKGYMCLAGLRECNISDHIEQEEAAAAAALLSTKSKKQK